MREVGFQPQAARPGIQPKLTRKSPITWAAATIYPIPFNVSICVLTRRHENAASTPSGQLLENGSMPVLFLWAADIRPDPVVDRPVFNA